MDDCENKMLVRPLKLLSTTSGWHLLRLTTRQNLQIEQIQAHSTPYEMRQHLFEISQEGGTIVRSLRVPGSSAVVALRTFQDLWIPLRKIS